MARNETIGVCAKCGRQKLKKSMATLYVKEWPFNPQTLCHVCEDCLPGLLDFLDVSMPERR